MARRARYRPLVPCLALFLASTAQTAPDIQVNALLPNQAVVTIDGQQRTLKAGKSSPEGVTLLSADSKTAVFEWQGQQLERSLSRQITSQFSERQSAGEARIARGRNNHYFTPGHINGQLVDFIVDTGASSIAMNHREADRLGIDWRNGRRFMAGTAGGDTPSYRITLDTVSVGDITLRNVEAAVVVADTSNEILLGMTFLSRMEMREEGNVLVLRKKY